MLEERVTRLEHEMAEVRKDCTETRALASGAHEDVGDGKAALNAHIKSLNSLRDTQNDHHEEMKREFADVRSEIADVRSEMRDGFGKMGAGMEKITALLNVAIDKGDTN